MQLVARRAIIFGCTPINLPDRMNVMLCVSIGRGRHRHMIAEHQQLVAEGAQLVELRLDYIEGTVNLRRLLADRPSPVVITCRRKADGGKWSGTEPERLLLIRTAIAEGVEYIDLEEDAAAAIPRFGKTKRIISFHDFRRTPDNLSAIHGRLARLDADIVKLATMANRPHDNLRMFRLMRDSHVPTVAFCMGDMGLPSRILCGRLGAPFTYATFHHERVLAPGQLSYQQMMDVYHYESINDQTVVYGVIADPVGHSLSPQIHNAAFHRLGMNCVYVPLRVPSEYLETFLEEAPEMGIRGLSVTIPHKEAVLPKLASSDADVQGIGAANTLIFNGSQIAGYNTDCQAAMDSLQHGLEARGMTSLEGRKALILGAGGAARAIAYGLRQRGADVVIASRTLARSESLAASLIARAVDWSARHAVNCDVLVNCTPIGMHPNMDETPFEKHHLRPAMTVFDTVYNPENTLLIKEARSQSCGVVTGVEMFVRQAALQFERFTGQEAPRELMRETLKRATGAARIPPPK